LKLYTSNNSIEIILKQYFSNLEIVAEDLADIKVIDQEGLLVISLKSTEQSWQLIKPISISLLINVFEQANQILNENIITIGPIKFFPNSRLCVFNEEEIFLTQKETEILLYLASSQNEVDKATLLHQVWGYSKEVSTHTLETHIYKLRNKFADKYELISFKDSGYALNFKPQQKD
jgi:DNA-binding response OmpR family regulator